MTPSEVAEIVGPTGFMSPERGVLITDFIHHNQLSNVLELGFAHGVSTCYLAAAVSERNGTVTSIDLESARQREPRAEELLDRCGSLANVTLYHEQTSYNWRLMKLLEVDPQPRFDFCFIDGAHNWFVDGLAFFLADRLLVEGGWFIFDDLNWTYDTSPTLKETDFVKSMSEEERSVAQIKKVFDLLVKTQPNYGEFMTKGDWGYARKLKHNSGPQIQSEVIYLQSIGDRVWSIAKNFIGRKKR